MTKTITAPTITLGSLAVAATLVSCSADNAGNDSSRTSSGGAVATTTTEGNNGAATGGVGASASGGASGSTGTGSSAIDSGGVVGTTGGTGAGAGFVPPTVEPRTCAATGTSVTPEACGEDAVVCNELKISDFELDQHVYYAEDRNGSYYTFGDITDTESLHVTTECHAESSGCLYATGSVPGDVSAIGALLRQAESGDLCSIDATYVDGVQFAAKGAGNMLFIAQEWHGGETGYSSWHPLTPDWKIYRVRFDSMQDGAGYDGRSLLQLFWMFYEENSQFELWLDDVYFFVD